MKYTTEIYIDLPREDVIALFEDTTRLPDWQRGLQETKLLKGKSGEIGAKRKLKIKLEGQKISMFETITDKDLPNYWHGNYSGKGFTSSQKNYFEAVHAHQTYWKCESEFNFSGFMIVISKLLPTIFKKRSELVMKDFKAFAENGISQRNT
ncbi:SRPBCC family protein [Psychroflexus planctonicus]|uniref:SRPBCC family protein n=1 Tax=Psychroflexus planctonicus TaxID=1526575 RepID=A0ABQ1SLA9_9FLAO|nr:SRPBCC family protein [Psychroflexus planctonicus]GGE42507.1 hypothetical protein GCM10010832_23080 [Psychroflexus planctonicus]